MAKDILDSIASFLARDSEPDSEKKLLLRQLIKDLSQNKYARFFRIKSSEADPSLASFFYAIYKIVFPIRLFVRDTEKMARLKQITLEAFMDKPVLETVRQLTPKAISDMAKTMLPGDLSRHVDEKFKQLVSGFDQNRIHGVNRCYNMIMAFTQFVNFNFLSLLKKFNPNIIDGNFSGDPRFDACRTENVAKDLNEFLAVSHSISSEGDWKTVLGLLKVCTGGQDIVPVEMFRVMLGNLKDVLQSKILDMMIQYTLKNPAWQWKPKIPDEHLGESWLDTKKLEVQGTLNKIANTYRESQIENLAKVIFGAAAHTRLENYTVAEGAIYRNKDLEDFIYAEGLNYLKAFLEDYVEKEIREICDIVLIRGQWTSNSLSRDMSESFHQLMDLSAPIEELDATMAEDAADGSRLKTALIRVDRDKTQVRYINSIIGNNNEEALELINTAIQDCEIIGRHLKNLQEDLQKRPSELIINWKELSMASKTPLPQRMLEAHALINDFVQLLQCCADAPEDSG